MADEKPAANREPADGDLLPALESSFSRLLAWIAAADAKASMVFGFATAMLGVLIALVPPADAWRPSEVGVAAVASVGLLLALIQASLASFPRSTPSHGSLVFFADIASQDFASYWRGLRATSTAAYAEELARHCHTSAEIATVKFRWVRWGMTTLHLATPPWVVAVYLLYHP
jgi:hypothetical protein